MNKCQNMEKGEKEKAKACIKRALEVLKEAPEGIIPKEEKDALMKLAKEAAGSLL